ncbi:MAG: hypothetical protein ACREJF_07790, partial [Candidatus Methylomirabilales bacterium]
ALRSVGVAAGALAGMAGVLLLLFPHMDHHWLNWLEEGVPSVQLAFLTPGERVTYRDSREAIRHGQAERERLRNLQQEVQWGVQQMPGEQQERLRQFLASRGEIAAGDQMVLRTLRRKARERQRFALGLPFVAVGGSAALILRWTRRGRVFAAGGGMGVSRGP